MKHILCMGRTRSVPGPCKGYVSYMYVHIILYYRSLFDIVLYHPMLCLGSDPILFSSGNLWGSPKATNMRLPKEKSMGLPQEKSMGLPQTLKSDFLWGYPHPKIWVLGGGIFLGYHFPGSLSYQFLAFLSWHLPGVTFLGVRNSFFQASWASFHGVPFKQNPHFVN